MEEALRDDSNGGRDWDYPPPFTVRLNFLFQNHFVTFKFWSKRHYNARNSILENLCLRIGRSLPSTASSLPKSKPLYFRTQFVQNGPTKLFANNHLHLYIFSLHHRCPKLGFSSPIRFFGKVREIDSRMTCSRECNSFSSTFHTHIGRNPRKDPHWRSLH